MINELYDVTIIGGGPAGLFAAFYAGLRHLKVKIIESLPQLGGQLTTLYPEKYIYDIAGLPKVKAKDLVGSLTEQANQFHPTIVLQEKVEILARQVDGTFILKTNNSEHLSKTVIIAGGVGAFEPRRLKVDDSATCGTENVHYFIDDMTRFVNKRVVILGGGDSAVDWANTLEPIAKEVTIIHRRFQFRAHESSIRQMMESAVHIIFPYRAKHVSGDAARVHELIIQNTGDESTRKIALDELVVCYGFVSTIGPIKNWGLSIKKNTILVNSKMETGIPGVYAVGDIAAYDGKIKLIASGFGESPIAVNHAKKHIEPAARTQPVHSSDSPIFS